MKQKTSMMELIEYVDSIWENGGWEETIKEKAKQLLEKEKEQIMGDFKVGYDCGYLDNKDNGEYYYNQTYLKDK